ncbi:MAG: single-stranded-DNA-specific exonuclease RecJ [Candidatus Paceibacterota bacterium]
MKAPLSYLQKKTKKLAPHHLSGYSDIARTLLIHRGVYTDEEAKKILEGDYVAGLHDPFLMKGMQKAVDRIVSALKKEEHVAIFSDYDADGVPGGVLLRSFFDRVGFKHITSYIPHRGIEGFGLNKEAVETLSKKGVTLMITIDCGITDTDEVLHAKELGIDVIITDHHLPPDPLPEAHVILDPKQADCAYPFKELCGAGVAYKLVQALMTHRDVLFPEGHEKWLLDLVGIATLADMVPLVGENRIFARYGLVVLQKGRRPGLRELLKQAKVDYRFVNEEDVTFTVAPRINAASRMAHPDIAFALLFSSSRKEALRRAVELEEINKERKTLVAGIVREVKKKVAKRVLGLVIVVGDPHWRPGILGLIASALVDTFGKTVFVWGREGDGHLKGSVRSDGVMNVVELMRALPEDSFVGFGGHERSAGFSIELDKVDLLEELLNAQANGSVLSEPHTETAKTYDSAILAKELEGELFEDVLALAPFGIGFEKPLFKIEKARVVSLKEFGKGKNHLEVVVEGKGSVQFKSIGFFMTRKHFEKEIAPGEDITLYGSLEKSYYTRSPEYRIRIEHIE